MNKTNIIDSDDDEFECVTERKQSQLIGAVRSLYGKKKKSPRQISVTQHRSGIAEHETVVSTASRGTDAELDGGSNKKNKKFRECDEPLPRHELERIERKIAYENVQKEVSKYDSIVKQNRKAAQLIFPAQKQVWNASYLRQNTKLTQPRTDLEREIAALMMESKDSLPNQKTGLSKREERDLKRLSNQQAIEYLKELRKHRELLSYKAAKDKRMKQIKSKKWLKRMRKIRLEREKKELEYLEKTDKEAFLLKIAELEKIRMQERMSLKHREGSKFSKKQMLYKKYDDKARQAVQEMLQKNKDLTKKIAVESEEEANDVEEMIAQISLPVIEKVPQSSVYLKPVAIHNQELDSSNDIEDNEMLITSSKSSDMAKFRLENSVTLQDAGGKKLKRKKSAEKISSDECTGVTVSGRKKKLLQSAAEADLNDELVGDTLISETLVHKRTMQDFEECGSVDEGESSVKQRKLMPLVEDENLLPTPLVPHVEPQKLLQLATDIKCKSDDDNYNDQRMTMEEAFADEDVVAEFSLRKSEIAEREKPKDINLYIPGWGDWGGPGIVPSKKKLKKFLIKAPLAPPRKDFKIGHIIINEQKNLEAAKHQVSEVPFPFTSVAQFEKSLQQPLGKNWNTELGHKQLCKARVVTKLGAVIEPMNKSEVFAKVKDHQVNKKWKREMSAKDKLKI